MAKLTYAAMAAGSSNTPPDWRYDRCQDILHRKGRRWSQARDDDATKTLVRYLLVEKHLLHMGLARSEVATTLIARFPHVHRAYGIYKAGAGDPNRYVIEARILARQPYGEIASRMGIAEETVDTFEKLFFNVSHKLDAVDYIVNQVIGRVFQVGLGAPNHASLAKYFGYYAGSKVLDLILNGIAEPRTINSAEDAVLFLDQHMQSLWRIQSLSMATTMQPGRFDVRTLWDGYTQLLALDQKASSAGEQSDWIASLTRYLSSSLPIPRGSAANDLAGTELANYAAGCVELRAHEQNTAFSEGGLPYLQQLKAFVPPKPGEGPGGSRAKPSKE